MPDEDTLTDIVSNSSISLANFKLCKDCKHYTGDERCEVFSPTISPIDGRTYVGPRNAITMRLTLCGWRNPRLWEPKNG